MTRDTGHLIPKVPPHGSNARNIVFYLTDIKNPFHAHNMEQETQQQKPYEPTLFFLVEDEGERKSLLDTKYFPASITGSFFRLIQGLREIAGKTQGLWVKISSQTKFFNKIVFYVFSCFGKAIQKLTELADRGL